MVMFVVFLTVCMQFIYAFQNFTIKKVPNWVKDFEMPYQEIVTNEQSVSGTHYLLVNEQINLIENSHYYHYSRKIINEEGLNAETNLSFVFDPSYEQLVLHSIKILRNDQVINKLKRKNIEILQRESRLDTKIYDGKLTAILLLDDLRVGDIIEYKYTVLGWNPVFENKFSTFFRLNWGESVEKIFYRLITENNRNIQIKNHLTDIKPKKNGTNNVKIYTWEIDSVIPVKTEYNTPSWVDVFSYIQVSEYESWNDIATWASELYTIPKITNTDLKKFIQALKTSNKVLDEKIIDALRYVQDDIKYLGIEYGINGFKPADPNDVVLLRYGDCKGKTNLFRTILKEIGIESVPYLVNTSLRGQIKSWLPTPFAFDHVITKVTLNGNDYWVDPTKSLQGGKLETIPLNDYEVGLEVNPQVLHFSPIKTLKNNAHIIATERLLISDFSSPVSLKITTEFLGLNADNMRSFIQNTSHDDISKNYLEFIAKYYPNVVKKEDVEITDERDKNIITVIENYLIKDFWEYTSDSTMCKQNVQPTVLVNYLPDPESPLRNYPFELIYPSNITNIVEVVLPEEWSTSESKVEIKNEAFEFNFTPNIIANTLTYSYNYSAMASGIDAEQFKVVYKDIQTMKDNIGSQLTKQLDEKEFTMNWVLLFLIILFSAFMIYGTIKLYKNNLYKSPKEYSAFSGKLEGLSGWLLVWGGGLFIGVVVVFINVFDYLYIFDITQWYSLTVPTSDAYHHLWAPIIMFEIFYNIALIIFYIMSIVAYFNKKSFFPRLMIIIMICNICYLVIDYKVASMISFISIETKQELALEIVKSALRSVIWIPYFLKSKRVKNTFLR